MAKENKGNIKVEHKDKVISNLEKKNKIIKTVSLSVSLIVIFIFAFLVVNGHIVFSKAKRLDKDLQYLGQSWYTDFYYDQVAEGKNKSQMKSFFSQFKEIGIKVSFGNIEKYVGKENSDRIDILKKAKCDKLKTKVTIYPVSPYGKNDYTIKTELDCESLK